jgi:hypothetical protein
MLIYDAYSKRIRYKKLMEAEITARFDRKFVLFSLNSQKIVIQSLYLFSFNHNRIASSMALLK